MMSKMTLLSVGLVAATVAIAATIRSIPASVPPLAPAVVLERLPDGAIQPQAAVDSKGTVHVVFFKGKPEAGDLFYYRFPVASGPSAASKPIRVNSEPETAIAAGTIRCEQIAIGQGNRVHVVWNGLAPKNGKPYAPMYMAYARLNEGGSAFEPQRNLCKWTGNLDGGGSVAADISGNVYATWHTAPSENTQGESGRGVFLAVSRNNGTTFDRERMICPEPTGACACCSMRAFVDHSGDVRVLYRAAMKSGTERPTLLLTSHDKGQSFTMLSIDPWTLNSCPMSSFAIADNGRELLAAWETRFQVFWSPIGADNRPSRAHILAGGAGKSKHPLLLANGKGQTLFAWTEDTAWAKGGSLSWRMYDAAGEPVGAVGHSDGVPTWSLLSGYAKPNGTFCILY